MQESLTDLNLQTFIGLSLSAYMKIYKFKAYLC